MQHGAMDIFIPHIEDYNLVDPGDIRRMYDDALQGINQKDVVIIHLAAHVGGIGAEPRTSCGIFLRQLDDGCRADASGIQTRRWKVRCNWNSVRLSQIHASSV